MSLKNTEQKESWINPNFIDGLVSIIVPTYNRSDLIIETLDSAYNQTYRPIEIIIIDDGSTDNTSDVVDDWICHHPNDSKFTCSYEYQENYGVCAARNLALNKSKGQYIQFLDSDDTIYPERLEKLVTLFHKSDCDYIETGFEGFLSENREIIAVHKGHTKCNQLELLMRGRLWPNTLRPAFTRNLIIRTGSWNENMVTFQDYEYVIRALTLYPLTQCESIGEVLASARRDGGGNENGRMSDILKTREGRILRIHCEKVLCEAVHKRADIPQVWKQQLASRIYALGFRSNASGWADLGKQCGEIANSMDVELDSLGMRRKLVWKMGRLGGLFYQWLSGIKNSISG